MFDHLPQCTFCGRYFKRFCSDIRRQVLECRNPDGPPNGCGALWLIEIGPSGAAIQHALTPGPPKLPRCGGCNGHGWVFFRKGARQPCAGLRATTGGMAAMECTKCEGTGRE